MRFFDRSVSKTSTLVFMLILILLALGAQPFVPQNDSERQIIINTQKLSDVERRLSEIESWRLKLTADQEAQDVKLATMVLQYDHINSKIDMTNYLLGLLLVGFLGRIVWEVVGAARREGKSEAEMHHDRRRSDVASSGEDAES